MIIHLRYIFSLEQKGFHLMELFKTLTTKESESGPFLRDVLEHYQQRNLV